MYITAAATAAAAAAALNVPHIYILNGILYFVYCIFAQALLFHFCDTISFVCISINYASGSFFSSYYFHFFYSSNHFEGFSIDVEFFASAYRIFNSQFRLNISQFTGNFSYECRTHKWTHNNNNNNNSSKMIEINNSSICLWCFFSQAIRCHLLFDSW